jgi:hypothetical protein
MSRTAYSPAAALYEVGELFKGSMNVIGLSRHGRAGVADIHIALATVSTRPLPIRVHHDMSSAVRAPKSWSLEELRLAWNARARPMIDHQVALMRAL